MPLRGPRQQPDCRALFWGTVERDRQTPCASFEAISEELRKVFRLGVSSHERSPATCDVLSIPQRNQWQTSPTSEQRAIRVTRTTWYTATPSCMVCQTTLRMLVSSPLSSTLDGLIELTTKLDLRVWAKEGRGDGTTLISSAHLITQVPHLSASPASGSRLPFIPAKALDGHLLGTVTHLTCACAHAVLWKHHKTIQFHLLPSYSSPLILGFPWLSRHNPHVDWTTGTFLPGAISVTRSASEMPLCPGKQCT